MIIIRYHIWKLQPRSIRCRIAPYQFQPIQCQNDTSLAFDSSILDLPCAFFFFRSFCEIIAKGNGKSISNEESKYIESNPHPYTYIHTIQRVTEEDE